MELEFKQEKTSTEVLSAGICDNCDFAKMENTGNGVDDPLSPELICQIKRFIVEPLPEEDQLRYCCSFKDNRL